LSADEAWEKNVSLRSWGPHKFPNSSWIPLNNIPTQHEAARSIGAHNINKRLEC
jgi:hypothetical protein